jgi:stage IV sporulation protein FB
MKNILKLFKINIFAYIYFLLCLLTGYIKESLIIFSIVIIHELGHIISTILLRYKIIRCELYPFGGMTIADKKINTPLKHDLLIYLSGVISQILIGFIIYFTCNSYTFLFYNKIIIIFNLIPIYPLDGFYILSTLIQYKTSYYKSLHIMKYISITSLAVFIIFYSSQIIIITFLIIQNFNYTKSINKIHYRFLLERFLYNFPYNKIVYLKCSNLKDIKRDCLCYFKSNKHVSNERDYLAKTFDINSIFW